MEVRIPKWSSLAKVQKIRIVRSMYVWLFVVPVLAKLLSKVGGIVDLNVFGQSFTLELGLPFSWKIFYFAALCFAAANLVFLARSYSLINHHSSFSDFQSHGKSKAHLIQYVQDAGLVLKNFHVSSRTTGVDLQYAFWEVYDVMERLRPASRHACTTLYVTGFALIGVVILQNLKAVLKLLL